MPKASRPSVVKSAVRVLQILEYFDEVRGPATIVNIAKALRYPQSSASALLRSMVAMGYLEYDPLERTYLPTDRVPLLGNWINPKLFREGSILRVMENLNRETGAVVVLAARNGDFAQYIHVVDAENPANVLVRLGQRRPIAASGAGWALLAQRQDGEVRKLLHRLNAQASSTQDLVRFDKLSVALAHTRHRGYALSLDQVAAGVGMIAMVIPNTVTHRPLALGLGLSSDELRARERELAAAMFEQVERYLANTEICEQPQVGVVRNGIMPVIGSSRVAPFPSGQHLMPKRASA
jgi:DNA-binding IclR family transcriptional regulator